MFINALTRGGGETQFLRVARALHRAGYDVRIFTLQPGDDFAGTHDAVPATLLAPRVGPATIGNAVRELRAWRPDAVVNFLYQATLVGRFAAVAARVPVVVSSMRNERLERRIRTVLYRLSGTVDAVTVTNSQVAAGTLRREGTIAARKLKVIPNGVDLALLDSASGSRSTLRAQLGVPDGQFLFLGVGRLAPQKDWPTLVDAIARYDGPDAAWVIAGEGDGRDALLDQIERQGLGGRVRLLGLRDDVPQLLGACDGLVLSSTYEGLPNVVLEAMACARPVVATRVGGCEELLGTEFGTLVDPRSPDQLARAMAELAGRSEADRRATGQAARDHIQARYALESADRRWVALIDDLRGARA